MLTIEASTKSPISLGRLGENEYRQISFDLNDYFELTPHATFYLMNQRPGDNSSYPVEQVTRDGNHLLWPVKSADVSAKGIGHCELIMMQGDTIAKSVIFATCVLPGLDGSGPTPSPWDSLLEQFIELKNAAEAAAEAAAAAAAQAAQYALRISVVDNTLKIEHLKNTENKEV